MEASWFRANRVGFLLETFFQITPTLTRHADNAARRLMAITTNSRGDAEAIQRVSAFVRRVVVAYNNFVIRLLLVGNVDLVLDSWLDLRC